MNRSPLTVRIEGAKKAVITAVNQATAEYGIPAFVMEGIISDVHQQITSRAKAEMLEDFHSCSEEKKENSDG